MRNLPNSDSKEQVYSEWDEEYSCFGVFGLDTGFCYGQHGDEEQAIEQADQLNRVRGYEECDYCNGLQKPLYDHTEYSYDGEKGKKRLCTDCSNHVYEQECAAEAHMEDPENFIRYRDIF